MPIMEVSSSEISTSSSPQPTHCILNNHPILGKQCFGCGNSIQDRFYLFAAERPWHTSCLRCSHCRVHLDNEPTCFARSGAIYCKEDYYRLFSVKQCARCCQGIFASELVMRARELVYHLHCFTCAWCNTALSQGDYFGIRNNLVYCQAHFESLVRECSDLNDFADPSDSLQDSTGMSPNYSPGPPSPCVGSSPSQPTAAKKGRPRKRKTSETSELQAVIHSSIECQLSPGSGGGMHLTSLGEKLQSLNSSSQRTKRMRTSFKHHQLRTMKSYFSINQNPDAKDLKQLAQKTGLSKRVLQVWFQNARAKWRRNNLRNHDPSAPLVTQPPTTLPQSPGEISSFSEASPLSTTNHIDFSSTPTPHSIQQAMQLSSGHPQANTPQTPSQNQREFQELF